MHVLYSVCPHIGFNVYVEITFCRWCVCLSARPCSLIFVVFVRVQLTGLCTTDSPKSNSADRRPPLPIPGSMQRRNGCLDCDWCRHSRRATGTRMLPTGTQIQHRGKWIQSWFLKWWGPWKWTANKKSTTGNSPKRTRWSCPKRTVVNCSICTPSSRISSPCCRLTGPKRYRPI